MKIISTLVLFVMSLFAENPAVYAPLGNVVYNNVEKIAKLKNIDIDMQNQLKKYWHMVFISTCHKVIVDCF